jgi:hypothetical protein
MGKDFTSAKGDDNVYTPYSMVEQLLKNEKFNYDERFLEPASGNGAIVKVLKKYCENVRFSDIQKDKGNCDFFSDWDDCYFEYIITNPPYTYLDKFIDKAKYIAIKKFAFLCKVTHLGSVRRFKDKTFIDNNYPLARIYMFTRQANLRFNTKWNPDYIELREDGKYPAGMYYYVWLIFEANPSFCPECGRPRNPTFHWINNDKYILRGKDKK